jgi:hypothetical protein
MPKTPQPLWLVIRKNGERVGYVQAWDAEAAVDCAIERFGLDPAERSRLAAVRVERQVD